MFENRRRRFDEEPRPRFRTQENWARSRREHYDAPRPHERIVSRQKIDRKKTCPMLIRVFCALGKHNKASDYAETAFPSNELRIYTWRDATLRELMGLITEVFEYARPVGTVFDFSVVFPNVKAKTYELRYLGTTCSGQDRPHDAIALDSTKFQVGDCLDVAIYLPKTRQNKL